MIQAERKTQKTIFSSILFREVNLGIKIPDTKKLEPKDNGKPIFQPKRIN